MFFRVFWTKIKKNTYDCIFFRSLWKEFVLVGMLVCVKQVFQRVYNQHWLAKEETQSTSEAMHTVRFFFFFWNCKRTCVIWSLTFEVYYGWVRKVQLNSEWSYEVIVSPKMPTKNLKDFCPIPSNKLPWQKPFKFLVGILGETMTS